MRGQVITVWHLHGECPARRHVAEESWEEVAVISNPVQTGIGKNQIVLLFVLRLPVFGLGFNPVPVRMVGARLGQHVGRAVETCDLGMGPALAKLFCTVTCAASQINDAPWMIERNLSDKIGCRTAPLSSKLHIKIGVPTRHEALNLNVSSLRDQGRLRTTRTHTDTLLALCSSIAASMSSSLSNLNQLMFCSLAMASSALPSSSRSLLSITFTPLLSM